MATVLFFVGIATIVLGVLGGLFSGSVLAFIFTTISAIISSLIFFSLSKVLENQEKIMGELYAIRQHTKKPIETITCKQCSKTYQSDYSSCPHCGARD
ncbi:MAG: hypothetical protein RSE93_01380 [Oscillospiraceae bacterium]